ncbi:MAG: hypothetical protein FWD86_00025 [Firmicutes bacterium]|nr:hypothetical protein [Bacillota bacterium]
MSNSTIESLSLELEKLSDIVGEMTNLKTLSVSELKAFAIGKIQKLEKLEELEVSQVDICNLDGIEKFNHLTSVGISAGRSLKTLTGLEKLPNLRVLGVGACPGLVDISAIGECKILESLYLENLKNVDLSVLRGAKNLKKLILSNCGSVQSLSFINELEKLLFFSFVGTNVVDGDLTPCLRLKYAATFDKRHYNLKCSQLPKNKDIGFFSD